MADPTGGANAANANAASATALPPITIRFTGRFGEPTFVLQAAPNLTVRQILGLAVTAGHLDDEDVEGAAPILAGKPLRLDLELSEYTSAHAIDCTYARPVRDRADPDVSLLLAIRLRRYLTHPPANTVVMICLGSGINTQHGHNALAEAQAQQFPQDVAHKLGSMRIVALQIDAAFAAVPDNLQIYGLDREWQPCGGLLQNRIRHFEQPRTGFQLSTYPTHLANWSNAGVLAGQTLVGVNLQFLAARLQSVGSHLLVRSWNGDVVLSTCGNLGRRS